MMATISVTTELKAVHCGECGGTYAIDANFHRIKKEKGGFWNCPYCQCSWGYPADSSELARLKRKLEYTEADRDRQHRRHQEEKDRHERTQRRLSATQGVVTRTKNRVAKGVCPCCNRTFQDLQRHMASKHPDYSEAEEHK